MNSTEAYIAESFQNIHDIITRGLKVSIENAGVFSRQGFTDQKIREGFFNYIQALIAVLNSHHLTEDEIAFPYFSEKLPYAPFTAMTQTHHVIVHILAEVEVAIKKSEDEALLIPELSNLENALVRLDDLWHPHIRIETNEFINKADELVPVEERLRLVELFTEHGQKHAGPPYLVVPFMLYNLPVAQRKTFSNKIPPEITQNLVPIVWKDQWESMKPFLLE